MRLTRISVIVAAGALTSALTLMSPAPGQPRTEHGLDIYFIDVEGGAATLMVTPEKQSILVDSGWPREDGRDAKRIEHVVRNVAKLGQIDHMVTTHWHTDHYGGIEQLARLLPIKRYWDRGIPDAPTDGARDFQTLMTAYKKASEGRSTALKAGDLVGLRREDMPVELKVVAANAKVIGEGDRELPLSCPEHPLAPVRDESDNMRSLALLMRCGRFEFLNCGDLTWNIEHKLACPENRVGKVDLWQVTHHGADQSNNPALVQAIEPRVGVICNGPRKGAAPRTWATLKGTKSLQAVYQLHRNVATGPENNTSPERIANAEENCKGEFIRVRLNHATTKYTVGVGVADPIQTFDVR